MIVQRIKMIIEKLSYHSRGASIFLRIPIFGNAVIQYHQEALPARTESLPAYVLNIYTEEPYNIYRAFI